MVSKHIKNLLGTPLIDYSMYSIEATHPYAIKIQRKVRNAILRHTMMHHSVGENDRSSLLGMWNILVRYWDSFAGPLIMYHRSSSLGMFCEICFPSHFCFSSTGPVIWHRKINALAGEYIGLENNFSVFIGQLCISSYLSRYFPSTTFLLWNKLHCIPHSDFLNLTLMYVSNCQGGRRERESIAGGECLLRHCIVFHFMSLIV